MNEKKYYSKNNEIEKLKLAIKYASEQYRLDYNKKIELISELETCLAKEKEYKSNENILINRNLKEINMRNEENLLVEVNKIQELKNDLDSKNKQIEKIKENRSVLKEALV